MKKSYISEKQNVEDDIMSYEPTGEFGDIEDYSMPLPEDYETIEKNNSIF